MSHASVGMLPGAICFRLRHMGSHAQFASGALKPCTAGMLQAWRPALSPLRGTTRSRVI